MLPTTIHSNVQSGAERKMFDAIRNAPGTDDWVCVHSLGLAHHGAKRRGEIDFALLTPEGVVVLEVKGGRIERTNGVWCFTDRFGVRHTKRESPFDQAASAMFALDRELREHFGRDTRIGQVLLGSAVMFPDIEFNAAGVEADRRQVYDVRDTARPLAVWVRNLFVYLRALPGPARNGLRKPEIEQLADYLRGDFEFLPSFNVVAADVNRSLIRLTRQQASSLPPLEAQPRLLIQGSAGTGKTLLALESARRASAAGLRVLVLCFNRLLAAHLRAALGAMPRIDVHHVHEYLRLVIARSPLAHDFEVALAREGGSPRAFDTMYPEYAALALTGDATRPYDCLVVDEAQDFLTSAMLDVADQSLLGGIAEGRWRVFLDANDQAAMYGQLDPAVLARLTRLAPRILLGINCRNTRQIGIATRVIAEPQATAEALHDGPPVENRWYDNDRGKADELRRVLDELRHGDVPPGCVSVIYPTADASLLTILSAAGVVPLLPAHVPSLGEQTGPTTHSTTSAFKGLENDVVVVAGVGDVDGDWWRAVNYVGLSRARVRLFVLLDAKLRRAVDARFARMFQATLVEEGR